MGEAEAVYKVHGGDEARFGGRAADVGEVGVAGRGRGEGADDAAVEGDFGGEVGEVEVAYGGGASVIRWRLGKGDVGDEMRIEGKGKYLLRRFCRS